MSRAQEQEKIEWCKTKAPQESAQAGLDMHSSDWGGNIMYHPNCYAFECVNALNAKRDTLLVMCVRTRSVPANQNDGHTIYGHTIYRPV